MPFEYRLNLTRRLQFTANSPLKARSRAFGKLDPIYLADLPNGISSVSGFLDLHYVLK